MHVCMDMCKWLHLCVGSSMFGRGRGTVRTCMCSGVCVCVYSVMSEEAGGCSRMLVFFA